MLIIKYISIGWTLNIHYFQVFKIKFNKKCKKLPVFRGYFKNIIVQEIFSKYNYITCLS